MEYSTIVRMKKTFDTIWISIAGAAAVLILISGFFIFDSMKKQKAFEEAENSLFIEVDESLMNAEYGEPFDARKAITSHEGEITSVTEPDTKQTGDVTVIYTLSKQDAYGKTAEKSFEKTLHIKDTKAPEITFKEDSVHIREGESFDPLANIEAVSDPVDGALKQTDRLENGTWIIEDETKPDTPGKYTVTVHAKDNSGNKTEKSYTVQVESAIPEFGLVQGSADYPYYIRINRALNTVTIYSMDEDGYYTVPYKAFVCSTGDATPLGTYNTTAKYRWLSLYGGVYGQYATRIVGAILFHSVPYFTEDPSDLEYEEYNKLGTAASLGCVRMCVRDVIWVYENCPVGTTVDFYDDWENPGPLGKPEPLTIDLSDDRRGWDPTDPDPSNPWNQ